jgi:hypothetical protein
MGSHMKQQQRTLKEIHTNICDNIKDMYASNGSGLSEHEAIEATNNLIRFCEKAIEIRSRERK